MQIWRLVAHHEDPKMAIAWFNKTGRIAVGWGRAGDLRHYRSVSIETLREGLKQVYAGEYNRRQGAKSLLNFWNMEVGDLVIITRGSGRRSHVVKVVGDYVWTSRVNPLGDYLHQRAAVTTDDDPDELWSRIGSAILRGQNPHLAVARCK